MIDKKSVFLKVVSKLTDDKKTKSDQPIIHKCRVIKTILIKLLTSAILPYLLFHGFSHATEYKINGILDLRAVSNDGINSYLEGGHGKYRFNETDQLSLSHLGVDFKIDWENNYSFHAVANGYSDRTNDGIGISEAYLQYKGLPFGSGLRYQYRVGMLYPRVSMENIGRAWSSPYSLSYSTLNGWIGEEFRYLGFENRLVRLGKLNQSAYDFELGIALMTHNDPAGAMLAWHGWVMTSRQSLWNESLIIPDFPARENTLLRNQAAESEPFLELDDRIGYHVTGEVKKTGKGNLFLGKYDNQADPKVVKNGQWGWRTAFDHIGIKMKISKRLQFIGQFLKGHTLMQSPAGQDLVKNDYQSGFVMLSYNMAPHRFTTRLEEFSITDNDNIIGDNNQEYGKAATFSYAYRIQREWVLHLENNWIQSHRYARHYHHLPVELIERQWQVGVRYYF
ncbi:hypothetical protein [Aliikangiella coralliicola]|uniref:Porin n=1 Tax=Aliikangiella coralliicola TaxID=2592383 RepID=A0A545UAB1_9GAMM|nr:hypothetical protein [Aliikangiella coralliicola]TQV86418.1 hypothetical protein FLL46_15985 [Aliikangiella coralliicola]